MTDPKVDASGEPSGGAPGGEVSVDELLRRLEEAQRLLISERNRRAFERAAAKAGIRSDRVDAAAKLAQIDSIAEELDQDRAFELARRIAAEYPEFVEGASPLSTDQGAPSGAKSRAKAAGDALEMLKLLRRG